MTRREYWKRTGLFLVGLLIMSIGVAMTKHASLGVTPISSMANVFSERFPQLSLGNYLVIWNLILILGQIFILKNDFHWREWIQLPISFLFGFFTDLGMTLVGSIHLNSYWACLLFLALATLVLALGVALTVIADIFLNSAEAFVRAVTMKSKRNFGQCKIIFDISCVVLSMAFSLVFFSGHIVGTREGTLISAIFTGYIVNRYVDYIGQPLVRWLKK